MKAMFKVHNQCTFRYAMHPKGYEFITTVDSDAEAWQEVVKREDPFIDDQTLTMTTDSGRVVWEKGDHIFDFGDYQYTTFELDKLQPDNYSSHGNMYQAIKDAQPWNMDEIDAIINENA